MIGLLSKVYIIDNCGGIIGRCIKVLKPGNSQTPATIGDTIVISVIKTASGSKIQKGDVHRAIVVRSKHKKYCSWSENSVVLLGTNGSPLGTRIKGPVSSKIKNIKVKSLAKQIF